MENISADTIQNSALKKSILRRVRAIWFLRKALTVSLVKFYIFILLSWQFLSKVSIMNIFANAPGATDMGKNLVFFGRAFVNTELAVKFILVAIVGVSLWLVFGILLRRGPQRGFYAKSA